MRTQSDSASPRNRSRREHAHHESLAWLPAALIFRPGPDAEGRAGKALPTALLCTSCKPVAPAQDKSE
jgi:hypothetical protein